MTRKSVRRAAALLLLLASLTLLLASCGGTAVTLHHGEETETATVKGEFTLPVPQEAGYAFLGWFSAPEGGAAYTDAEGRGLAAWSDENPTDLYAQWSPKEYTFELDVKDGECAAPLSFPMTYLSIFEERLPVPTRVGYSFLGWYNAEDVQVTAPNGEPLGDFAQFNVTAYPTNEEKTTVSLYAGWSERRVTFSFATNGGTEVAEVSAGLGERVSLPVTSKAGHCFLGWSRSGTAEDILPMYYTVKDTDEDNTALHAVYAPATVAGVTFTLIHNDTEYAVSYVGGEREVYIPDIYQGKRVTRVLSVASSVEVLYLPNTATAIEEGAMRGCAALRVLRLPSSLARISREMLKGCAALTELTIPGGVTAIDESALEGTALARIEIPAGVRSIGRLALASTAIETITVHPDNQYYSSEDGVLYQKTGTELRLQQYPRQKTGDAFTPPAGCTAIMDYAFLSVGYDAEGRRIAGALRRVTLGGKLKSVGASAFEGSSVAVAVIDTDTGSSLTFGSRAFYACRELRMIRFLNSAAPASVGDSFIGSSDITTYLYVPTASRSMYAQKLTGYTDRIRTENDIYGNYAVEPYLGGYRILQYLGYETEIAIPAYINGLEVKAIGSHAFSGSSTVTRITVEGGALEEIAPSAFADCEALAVFTLKRATPPTLGADALRGASDELRIYVPAGDAVSLYRAALGWIAYSDRIFTEPS